MNDIDLENLSLLELIELQEQLHTAIRAAIRAQQEARKSPRTTAVPAIEPMATTDLTRERDAWLARRRSPGP
jgi:hypothetical protein